MNDNKKGLIIAGIYFFMIFGIPILASISSLFENSEEGSGIFDYARITDVDYQAIVLDEENNGGNVLITETITFDVHAASQNNLFWELWRDLPEDSVDGLKIDYEVLSVKEVLDSGMKKEWPESPELYWDDYDYTSSRLGPGKWYHSKGPFDDYYNYECIFFYVDGIYRDTITFEIQYIMHNAALKYSDVSELYLTMYSEGGVNHLKSFDAEILIPYKDMPSDGNYLAHTFGTDNNVFEFTESKTKNPGYHTFSMSLDEKDLKFSSYNEFIEFTLLAYNEDKHKFTDYAPDNIYSWDVYLEEALAYIEDYDSLPGKYRKVKSIGLIICIALSIGAILKAINIDKDTKRKHRFFEPVQKITYFRDIPSDLDPYFAATLALSKEKKKADDGDAYSAILLNLVRKGYIKLDKINPNFGWINSNIMIEILYSAPTTVQLPVATTQQVEPYKSFFVNNQGESIGIGTLSSPTYQRPEVLTQQTLVETPQVSVQPQESIVLNPTPLKRMDKYGNELEELNSNEKAYFNLIVRHSTDDKISMTLFQQKISYDYDKTDSFVTEVDNSIVNTGITKGFLQKSNYLEVVNSIKSKGNRNIVFAILIGIVGNLIINSTRLDLLFGGLFIYSIVLFLTGIYYKKVCHKYVLLTQYGEDEYEKWHGLYNFLNSETLINEKTVIDVKLWEKYLVYATAFGLSEKVIKALEINCPDMSSSQMLSNNYYRSTNFRTSSRSFRSSVRSASSTSRSIRSGYSGGGYGGGGRGGGSGGGGH